MQTAIVKVGLLSFLEEIPAFTPPVSSLLPSGAGVEGADEGSLSFGGANIPVTGAATSESNSAGGANNAAAGEESASISAGGTAVFYSGADFVQSGFAQGNQSTTTPNTNPNLLWGAVATAALGATLADWQRKREEEQARKRAEAPAQEKKGGSGKKTPGQRAYEKKMKQKRIVGESQALLIEKAREKEEQSEKARQNLIAKNEDRAPVDMAKVNRLVQQAASQQARDDFRAGEREYAVSQAANAPKKETSWLSTLWNAGTSALGSVLSPAKETGGRGKLAAPALDKGPGWWDTVKGTIFDGVNQIKDEIKTTVNKIGEATGEALKKTGDSIKEAGSGTITPSQAWNNSTAAIATAYNNSVNAISEGYSDSQKIYHETVDTVIQKSATWLDEKRNPVYDLGVYGLEKLSGRKLIEARNDVFSEINPLGLALDLGKPDFFDAGFNISIGYGFGVTKTLSFVAVPETVRDRINSDAPDNNQIGLFYAPGVEATTPGGAIVSFYGTGYMLPGADPKNPVLPSVDRYLDSFLTLGAGGYSPIIAPIGGGVEVYDSMTDLQEIPESIDDGFGWLTTPGLMPAEQILQKYVSGKDIRDFPRVIGELQSVKEDAVIGSRVFVGGGTPGPEVHISISDSQYVNIFGRDIKSVNVPTPIMNALIDLRTSPNKWEW